jgi:uncharacterized damage-inducible protein DinB
MDAFAFQQLYDYHFSENRKIWDRYITLLDYTQFTQDVGYSYGSVREQIVHEIDVDDIWFSELSGVEPLDPISSAKNDDREIIRTHWDKVLQKMRTYLSELRDDSLFDKPITEPEEDSNLMVWQVLIHVVNHGTDHRAQLLRMLNDLGVETTSQDFIFYAYDHAQ